MSEVLLTLDGDEIRVEPSTRSEEDAVILTAAMINSLAADLDLDLRNTFSLVRRTVNLMRRMAEYDDYSSEKLRVRVNRWMQK